MSVDLSSQLANEVTLFALVSCPFTRNSTDLMLISIFLLFWFSKYGNIPGYNNTYVSEKMY